MEPLHPELRKALKDAHPGLTDAIIDRTEELLGRRQACDPEREKDKIAELDRERLEIIGRSIPRYAEVARAFAKQMAQRHPRPPRKVTVADKGRK